MASASVRAAVTCLIVAAATALWSPPGAAQSPPSSPAFLRVALRYGPTALRQATISGAGTVTSADASVGFLRAVAVYRVPAGQANVRVDGAAIRLSLPIRIAPLPGDPAPLALDGTHWRGALEIVADGPGLQVINAVALDDYVRGVVPNEMFADGEAFKAQAVISRTFALYVSFIERRWGRFGFDITAFDQIYGGADSETLLSNLAVEETTDQVLTSNGKIIFAAYDSNAGGYTDTVDVVWPNSDPGSFPYLRATVSPLDRAALDLPGYEGSWQWSRAFTWNDLRQQLARTGLGDAEITDLRVTYGGVSRRMYIADIDSSRGHIRLTGADRIRKTLNLPSARATVTRTAEGVRFDGFGLGHGVGLSQHAAWGMSRGGQTYDGILAYFYRGVRLEPFRPRERRFYEGW